MFRSVPSSSAPAFVAIALIAAFAAALPGCATRPVAQVRFDADVSVATKRGTGTARKGTAVEVADEAVVVSAPGRMPLLLVPLTGARFEASLPAFDATPVPAVGKDAPGAKDAEIAALKERVASADAMVVEFVRLQLLVARRNTAEAFARIAEFRRKWPEATYVDALEVSCYLAAGRLDDARRALPALLSRYPQDESIRALAARLGEGGAR